VGALALAAGALAAGAQGGSFGRVALAPDFVLDGSGTNVDSLAFWEAPDPEDTLLFVTSKGNQRVEVWRFPFVGNELPALVHPSFGSGTRVNGVAVDQDSDLLYVSVSSPASTVSVFSLPELDFVDEFIEGAVNLHAEPNLALLHRPGAAWLYVSSRNVVYVHDAASGAALASFRPIAGLETMAADDLDQVIYIPDENDRTGVYAYEPLGAPHERNGTNRFGAGLFEADAEGILVYRCLAGGGDDDGLGWIVVADQRPDHTDFEFFDRRTWQHLGTLELTGVTNTDGIASTQRALPGLPGGLFAAIDDDATTVGVGWHRILAATGLACPFPPAVPALSPGPRALLAGVLAAAGLAALGSRGAAAA
jgi:hypothetical protein